MSPNLFMRTILLHGKIVRTRRLDAEVSFELDGHSVSFPTRAARSPVRGGDVVSLVVRRTFWPFSGHVALAFAHEGAEKVRAVGSGLYVGAVLIGLPLLLVGAAIEIFRGSSFYALTGDDSAFWPTMIFGWLFVGYSGYRLVETARAVKILREYLRAFPNRAAIRK